MLSCRKNTADMEMQNQHAVEILSDRITNKNKIPIIYNR